MGERRPPNDEEPIFDSVQKDLGIDYFASREDEEALQAKYDEHIRALRELAGKLHVVRGPSTVPGMVLPIMLPEIVEDREPDVSVTYEVGEGESDRTTTVELPIVRET